MAARWGVRARVQISFAAGGLLVSVFLAAVSWNLTTTYLYSQREITATRAALVSADLLTRRIDAGQEPTPQALTESTALGNDAVYVVPGARSGVSATARVNTDDLPRELLDLAARGTTAQQRLDVDGEPLLAVAVPVQPAGAVYVELFPLTVLDATLNSLSVVLAGTAALATALAAAVGRWAAQRTLRPLTALVAAAGEVASGRLDTRLDAAGDPDLAPLADAFNDTTGALRARVERDARFASDVSHELRSPVTTMANAAELLDNRRAELSPQGQEALTLLLTEVDRFRALVEDLLEVSRDAQETEVCTAPVPLADLVRVVADRTAGRPVTRVDPAAAQVLVEVEPRRVDRIVGNLVRNADLHGGGVCDVVVQRTGPWLRITVRDEGPGIPAAERGRVFERFFRGAASRGGAPGSGLGLPIVEQHVRACGGIVRIEDAASRGTAFVVELPVAEDAT